MRTPELQASVVRTPLLRLITGLPGSGKTIAALVARESSATPVVLESVDRFGIDYAADAACVALRTQRCLARVDAALRRGVDVYVHACFARARDAEPYRQVARDAGADVDVVDLYDAGLSDQQLLDRCVHNVPMRVISALRARYEPRDAAARFTARDLRL